MSAQGSGERATYPKPCGLCPGIIESVDDNDWHGYGNCIEITQEMWAQWEKEAAMIEPFDDWWERDGKFFDPDTDDVPWFDKRKFLAEYAFMKAIAQTRNYVCDEAVLPGKVTFANGRTVQIVERTDGTKGYFLAIGGPR